MGKLQVIRLNPFDCFGMGEKLYLQFKVEELLPCPLGGIHKERPRLGEKGDL